MYEVQCQFGSYSINAMAKHWVHSNLRSLYFHFKRFSDNLRLCACSGFQYCFNENGSLIIDFTWVFQGYVCIWERLDPFSRFRFRKTTWSNLLVFPVHEFDNRHSWSFPFCVQHYNAIGVNFFVHDVEDQLSAVLALAIRNAPED